METQEITIIDRSVDTFKNASLILKNNQERAAKAIAIGKKILADLAANNNIMTPELDARMQKYLANCSAAKSGMNEERKLFTQTMTLIAKAFTSEEGKIDAAASGTEAYEIQQIRNRYAKQLHEEEQERLRQLKLKQEKDQEVISIKAECEKRLTRYVGEAISAEKQRLNTSFNAITLDTFDKKSVALQNMQPAYAYAHFTEFRHGITSRLFSPAEIETMLKLDIETRFSHYSSEYKIQIGEEQQFLIERLPSKKQELEAIKKQTEEWEAEQKEIARIAKDKENADAEQRKVLDKQLAESKERQRIADEKAKELADEQKKREGQDRKDKDEKEKQRIAAQEQVIEQEKEVATTMSLFNSVAEATDTDAPAPEVRQGYEIIILGPAAWMQIFQQWFTETGSKLDEEKIAATKMETMRSFCAKLAHKDESKKISSNFLKYEVSMKAVNRKVK